MAEKNFEDDEYREHGRSAFWDSMAMMSPAAMMMMRIVNVALIEYEVHSVVRPRPKKTCAVAWAAA